MAGPTFPAGVTIHHRDQLDRVQRELREAPGVSALIYDQTCAAEARRLRKRGEFPDPDRRVVINELVCEGCGDCSVQSNCISIEPVETELGRKRRINQSSCNKDYSCLKGHCPSFVTIEGGRLRKFGSEGVGADEARFAALPEPSPLDLERPWNVLVTGIGGIGRHHGGRAARDGRAPRGQGLLGARRDRARTEERPRHEPRARRGAPRRDRGDADRRGRCRPRDRLRHRRDHERGEPREGVARTAPPRS